MIISVTGCGPTLKKEQVVENSFIIGINRSYELIKPNIICTADKFALEIIKKANRKEPVYYSFKTPAVPKAVLELKNSGTFAVWMATRYVPEIIYLLGFGGKKHFYKETGLESINFVMDEYRNERNGKALEAVIKYIKCPIKFI